MTKRDLISMGVRNLLRRKTRTILTVFGVIIGTASIVVMLSFGFGMNRSFMKSMEQMGDLTVINVRRNRMISEEGGSTKQVKLDDLAVEKFKKMKNVDAVMPIKREYVRLRAGRYEAGVSIIGVDVNSLHDFGFKLSEGEIPSSNTSKKIIVGKQALRFRDPKSRNYNAKPPEVDLMNTPMKLILQEMMNQKRARGINVEIGGIIEGENNERSYSAYMSLEALEKLKEDYNKRNGNLNSNNNRDRRRQEEDKYNNIKVKVKTMDDVESVQKKIKSMGYEAWAITDMLKEMQSMYKTIQAVLGGIGAVSLLVAAIGITNTMVMSIYERTKEIGIMKVIGAELKDIKKLFLLEAALIGFIGGAFGIGISYGISIFINNLSSGGAAIPFMMRGGEEISYIPLWLPVASVLFSTLIGVISGYYPAHRAMKLSALEAIRK